MKRCHKGIQRKVVASNNKGLTLIESLVAIVVITATLATVTPVVVLAVATRVQNQRAEQAFQVAQAEIDNIKSVLERGGDTLNLPVTAATVLDASEFEAEVPAPDTLDALGLANPLYSSTYDNAKAVDVDGDGTADFGVQLFRTVGSTSGTTPISFDLGVRVYRADAITNNSTSLETTQAALRIARGEGQTGTRPIAVVYTSLARSDNNNSLCDYYYTQSAAGLTASTPAKC